MGAMLALTLVVGCEREPGTVVVPCPDRAVWHVDQDGDGFGDVDTARESCTSPGEGWVVDATDCDDTLAAVFPGATPACDGTDDDDCDGEVDANLLDVDGDGASSCDGDCDDRDAGKLPGLPEVCNGKDDDCDGDLDEADPDVVLFTCDFCPPAQDFADTYTFRYRTVNACVLDPNVSLCRSPPLPPDTHEQGERLHHVVYPTMPWGVRPQLLLWLPPGPGLSSEAAPAWGAYSGYRTITLGWPNDDSTDAVCRRSGDFTCYEGIRQERVFGDYDSPRVAVNGPPDSIVGRTRTLLRHLAATYPDEAWDDFLDESGEVQWDEVLLVGWSEGATSAAYLGMQVEAAGEILLAPGLDLFDVGAPEPVASTWWTARQSLTPPDRVWLMYSVWDPMAFPEDYFPFVLGDLDLVGPPVIIDDVPPPYDGSQVLRSRSIDFTGRNCTSHGSIAVDDCMHVETVQPAYFHMYCELPMAFPLPH